MNHFTWMLCSRKPERRDVLPEIREAFRARSQRRAGPEVTPRAGSIISLPPSLADVSGAVPTLRAGHTKEYLALLSGSGGRLRADPSAGGRRLRRAEPERTARMWVEVDDYLREKTHRGISRHG